MGGNKSRWSQVGRACYTQGNRRTISIFVSVQLPQENPALSEQESEDGEVLQSRIAGEGNAPGNTEEASTLAITQLIQKV